MRTSPPRNADETAHLVLRLIQAYAAKPSTELLREMAEQVARLRQYFTSDGGPDWAGKSWEYRQAMNGIYEDSGVTPEVLTQVKNGLRYHLGNYLRERLSPEELRTAGLRPASPKDRIEAARAELMARAVTAGMSPPSDLAGALERIGALLGYATTQAAGSTERERRDALEALEALSVKLEALREILSS